MQKRQEQLLRASLARTVGRESLPDGVWEHLLSAGYVRLYQEGENTAKRLLEDHVRALLFAGDVMTQAEASPEMVDAKRIVGPPRFDPEAERAKALLCYLQLRVSTHPDVLRFRGERLPGGRLLNRDEAHCMIESTDIHEAWSGIRAMDTDEHVPSGHLRFPAREQRGYVQIGFLPGTVFERLQEVSKALRQDVFPPWAEENAVWAVVTGEIRGGPQPLVGEAENHVTAHLTYGRINLSVEPWVPTESVVKAYQWLQAQMLKRKPRTLIERNVRVVRFVFEALGERVFREPGDGIASQKLSWRNLMDWWNEANPDQAYEDERHFHRDFRRTANAVVRPYGAASLTDDEFNRLLTVRALNEDI